MCSSDLIEWLEGELKGLSCALVLISHDRRFLETLSRTTVWLDRGIAQRVEIGFGQFEAWRDQKREIIILSAALVVLTLILAFQQQMAKWRAAHRWIRNGFLAFTLVWIGWIASAQLSIINVINYLRAPFERFDLG